MTSYPLQASLSTHMVRKDNLERFLTQLQEDRKQYERQMQKYEEDVTFSNLL